MRLHHNAYVTRDQEKTRQFYEDVIGMPLVATWCESDELFGKVRTYCHTFYEMGDGGALAFFQFEDPKDQEEFGPKMPASPFHHIALAVGAETQAAIERRIAAAGINSRKSSRCGTWCGRSTDSRSAAARGTGSWRPIPRYPPLRH
jgi:glyoxylase I family protein